MIIFGIRNSDLTLQNPWLKLLECLINIFSWQSRNVREERQSFFNSHLLFSVIYYRLPCLETVTNSWTNRDHRNICFCHRLIYQLYITNYQKCKQLLRVKIKLAIPRPKAKWGHPDSGIYKLSHHCKTCSSKVTYTSLHWSIAKRLVKNRTIPC